MVAVAKDAPNKFLALSVSVEDLKSGSILLIPCIVWLLPAIASVEQVKPSRTTIVRLTFV